MKLRRALHLVGAGALSGALLLGTAPVASADDIRDRQWALDFFAAEDIWQHATGKGVTVAVVDTGVDASHPDLKGKVIAEKDFTLGTESADPRHGTAMASLIAAHGHGPGQNQGMKGLAPGAKILSLKAPTTQTHWKEIRYAVDHGADVINLSYKGSRDPRGREAVEYAIANDVVVVAGVGNSGTKRTTYPAAIPGVVSVGGLDRDGVFWDDSSWGSNTTLVAPAENNVTANSDAESGYTYTSGTSDSTAYISAAAALVRQAHPDLTAGQVINRLIKTALPLAEGRNLPDEKWGFGVVRPFRAVTYEIPAGPKEGPLAPSSENTESESAPADSPDEPSASSEAASESLPNWVYVAIPAALVVLAMVVILVVRRSKGGGNSQNGPYAPSAGVPPMRSQGEQQYPAAPGGQWGSPPAPPPSPPNQPPQR